MISSGFGDVFGVGGCEVPDDGTWITLELPVQYVGTFTAVGNNSCRLDNFSKLQTFLSQIQTPSAKLLQVVDPVPIRYVGDYLAFKMNTNPKADPTWSKWLADHDIQLGAAKGNVVLMACGGVFAEGVLGRATCRAN
jgi:hypothetical protein